jgi:hypothetical protein
MPAGSGPAGTPGERPVPLGQRLAAALGEGVAAAALGEGFAAAALGEGFGAAALGEGFGAALGQGLSAALG